MDNELKKQVQTVRKKCADFLRKWRIPLLVLAVGLLFALYPFGRGTDSVPKQKTKEEADVQILRQEDYTEQTERRLSSILSTIEGAGRVEVMLTVQGSDITYFQTDTDTATSQNADGSSSSTQYKTVILSGSGEYDKAAVTKTEYPAFRGALIVSEGADNDAVRLALVNAVSSLLGLGTDKISVVKMK